MEIIKQAANIDLVKILKNTGSIMEGHFKLTSGFHSKYYMQCARLLQYPAVVYGIISDALKEFGNKINRVVPQHNQEYRPHHKRQNRRQPKGF